MRSQIKGLPPVLKFSLRTGSIGSEFQTACTHIKEEILSPQCSRKRVCCWESIRQDPQLTIPEEMDRSRICIGL